MRRLYRGAVARAPPLIPVRWRKIFRARANFFLHHSRLRLFIGLATHSHVPMAHRGYATT